MRRVRQHLPGSAAQLILFIALLALLPAVIGQDKSLLQRANSPDRTSTSLGLEKPSASAAAEEPIVSLPPPPVVVTKPGKFEVLSVDHDAARAGEAMADEVWATLVTPLGLPANGFPTPVSLRLILPAQWGGTGLFRATAEFGGRVSVAVRWTPEIAGSVALRRAVVQGLLMQRALSFHGLIPGLKVPAWLEDACLAWSLTRSRPAALDAWQQASLHDTPPLLAALLARERGTAPDPAQERALLWLLGHLQAESGEAKRWPQFLSSVFGGEDSAVALGRLYGDLFKEDAARELWWQVGFHAQSRQAAQAIATAKESRAWVAERARWLARRGDEEVELSLDEIFAARSSSWVANELGQRILQLRAELAASRVHPFYRNAVVSLGRIYDAARAGDTKAFAVAQADLLRDVADARELEQVAAAALDKLETGR